MDTGSIYIQKITVQNELSILNYAKNNTTHEGLFSVYAAIHRMQRYIMSNEGPHETSIFVETELSPIVRNLFTDDPNYDRDGFSAISILFSDHLINTPVLFQLLKPITERAINIVEYASTRQEITFFVHTKDEAAILEILHKFME